MIKRNIDWRLYNLIEQMINEEMQFDGEYYMDTDNIITDLDGDTCVFNVPIDCKEYSEDWKKIMISVEISPDFTVNIRNMGRVC